MEELKDTDIKQASGGLLVNDDSKRSGWHCCECHHWFDDIDMTGFDGNTRKEYCPVCKRDVNVYHID